ncbi:MAG: hypothetical protein MEP57_05895 [Microvirga sp.]|nr:hypothetical protein [Microvirga sp.]
MTVFYCIEDALSRAVAERLIRECCPTNTTSTELGKVYGGFGYIKKNLQKFHKLAQRSPVLIITDLDRNPCAPSLRRKWLDSANIREPLPDKMLFCIAHSEIESWLLADTNGVADFLRISPDKLKHDIESNIVDSKEYLVNLAKNSASSEIRNDIAPSLRSGAATGINYNFRLCNFVENDWSLEAAARNSRSLNRAVTKLSSLMT